MYFCVPDFIISAMDKSLAVTVIWYSTLHVTLFQIVHICSITCCMQYEYVIVYVYGKMMA